MRIAIRVLASIAAVVLLIVAGVVLYVSFADLSHFRSQIEAGVSSAIGRDFRIAGEFRPKVLPTPSLVAADVTLANTSWGTQQPARVLARRAEKAKKLHLTDALSEGRSLRSAAGWLNERGVSSPAGGRWHAPSLLKAARRLGLR